ncbi:phage tail assembly chaperone G [Bacillus siamensis]|uniref:phage tail assembly chaperone G n=1 Tax=Bacillus siamensis TaxID=659243 RepID=UPI003F66FCCE
MQITLLIKGEEKVFHAPFIKGRMLREAIKLSKTSNFDELDVGDLDNLVDYVVRVYDGQFSLDDFYDGISSEKMISTISDTIQGVVGTVNAGVEQSEAAKGEATAETPAKN